MTPIRRSALAAALGLSLLGGGAAIYQSQSFTPPGIGDDEKLDAARGFATINEHERASVEGAKFDLATRYLELRYAGKSHVAALCDLNVLITGPSWYPGAAPPYAVDCGPLEPPPVEPPVAQLAPLSVEGNARWFKTDAGRFDYRELSAFSLLSRMLVGESDYVRAYLREQRARGFTVARVILTLDGDYWNRSPLGGRSFRSAPDMPGYWARLDELLTIAGEERIYIRGVFIGAVEPFGGTWHSDRRDVWSGDVRARGEAFILQVAERYKDAPQFIGELANEPTQIGLRDSYDDLISIGRRVKQIAPRMLLGGGAADGEGDTDVTMAVEPFDYVDAHIERRMAVRGFEWVKRSGEYPPIDQDDVEKRMPFISGEPVNFGEGRADGRTGDVEPSPSVAFAYAAVSRARQFNTNFHYDGGLWTTSPKPETVAAIGCYMAALNAYPMSTASKWRGHWAQSYWRQVWPNSDDTRAVEDHVASGRGPWRVFGSGLESVAFPEPENWDWRANLTAPASLVASCNDGAFQASIYRKD